MQLLSAMPENGQLWMEYFELLRPALQAKVHPVEAYAFYESNRAAMDAGCEARWPERKLPHELSAIQHAMHLLFNCGEQAFHAEYMNVIWTPSDEQALDPLMVATKLHNLERGRAPQGVEKVTAFIDVHKRLLYWIVIGWESNFTGYVIDYGTYPKQTRKTWRTSDPPVTLQAVATQRDETGKLSDDAAVYQGLSVTIAELCGRRFQRDDGVELSLDKLLIDAGWKQGVVKKAIRESTAGSLCLPSRGRCVGESECPISRYKPRPGGTVSEEEWCIDVPQGSRGGRMVTMDVNHWKSQWLAAVNAPAGTAGALTLFGLPGTRHELLARHWDSERRVTKTGERTKDIWGLKAGQYENHWLDCAVGAMVAASILGIRATGPSSLTKPRNTARQDLINSGRIKRRR
jgi:phage terminase large subunit GpA-like protein